MSQYENIIDRFTSKYINSQKSQNPNDMDIDAAYVRYGLRSNRVSENASETYMDRVDEEQMNQYRNDQEQVYMDQEQVQMDQEQEGVQEQVYMEQEQEGVQGYEIRQSSQVDGNANESRNVDMQLNIQIPVFLNDTVSINRRIVQELNYTFNSKNFLSDFKFSRNRSNFHSGKSDNIEEFRLSAAKATMFRFLGEGDQFYTVVYTKNEQKTFKMLNWAQKEPQSLKGMTGIVFPIYIVRHINATYSTSKMLQCIDIDKMLESKDQMTQSAGVLLDEDRQIGKIQGGENVLRILMYTTIKDESCANMNRGSKDRTLVTGFQSYATISRSTAHFVFLTPNPFLITVKSSSQGTTKNFSTHVAEFTRFKGEGIVTTLGKALLTNKVIVGPSKYWSTDEGINKTNLEYKWASTINFHTDKEDLQLEVVVVPYIVEMNTDFCYRYQVYVTLWENEHFTKMECTDFFIYETAGLKGVTYFGMQPWGIPAALDDGTMVIPPKVTLNQN